MQKPASLKQANEKLSKGNHLYAFISQINQNIVRVKDEGMLFHNACRVATQFGKFKMAWIGIFDIENKKINLVEENGISEEGIQLFTNSHFQVNGPQGHILRTGTDYICNDVEYETKREGWSAYASKEGIRSYMVLPIRKADVIIGTFNLYSSELNFLEKEEIKILQELAADISFALDRFDKAKKHKATEELLVKSEKQFRHTLNNMMEGAQIHDFEWRYLYVNDTLVNYSTYKREELIGFTLMEKYPGIEQTGLFTTLQRCMVNRVGEKIITEFVFPNGTKADFELSIEPIPEGIFILSVDHTEKKRAKEKLLKANRLYAFLSAINQSIVHTSNEQTLLNNICNIAVNVGQFVMGWVDKLDEQTGKMNMVSHPGIHIFTNEADKDSGLDYKSPRLRDTPTGRALRTGKYAVSNDAQNDPAFNPWLKDLTVSGIKSSISLPITKFGKVIGVFGFHSGVVDFFDAEEISLLEEAANDVSYSLEIFENVKLHKQAEIQVKKSEDRLKKAQNIAHIGQWDLDFATGVAIWSEESCRIYGIALEDNKQSFEFWASFLHPEDVGFVMKLVGEQRKALSSNSFNHRIVRRDGTIRYIHSESAFEFDENGKPVGLYGITHDVTESKLAELAQIESKNLIQTIYTASLDAVIIIDADGIITKWDEKSETLFGWKENEVTGRKLAEIILPPRYREMYENRIRQYLKTGKGPVLDTTIEIAALKRNGFEFDISLSITSSQINGKIHFIGFIRDISEKKLTEKQREFDKNNLTALINNTKDLMWSLDRDFNLITSNIPFDESGKISFGKAIEKGSSVLNVSYTPEMRNHFKMLYERAFAGEAFTETEHFEFPLDLWIEISYNPIYKGKEIIGAACQSRDITGMKKSKEKIEESELKYRSLIEQASDAIMVMGKDDFFSEVNTSAEKLFGFRKEELLLMKLDDLVFEEDRKTAPEGAGIAAAGKTVVYERRMKRKNSSVLDVEISARMLSDGRTLGIVRDISERKEMQNKLDKTLNELEHRVEIRTKELSEKNKNITDSINYAKRIQLGLFSSQSQLSEVFPDSFIFSQPRDIVSGDFVWFFKRRSKKFIVVADCTGHGVPGALMSIIGNNLLNQIIVDEHIENPSEILEILDARLKKAVNSDKEEIKDGMDIALCVIDSSFNELYFAGALRPLFITEENGMIREVPGNRYAIGGSTGEIEKKFETKRFSIIPGQRMYLSSDGYYSQFGGPGEKKYMKARFKKTLENIQVLPMGRQKEILSETLTEWRKANEQVDDVLVVGIQFKQYTQSVSGR